MKKLLTAFAVILATLVIAGCSGSGWTNKDTGMVAGGVVGGVAGNALTGGSAAGTVIGAVGGGYVGRQLSH